MTRKGDFKYKTVAALLAAKTCADPLTGCWNWTASVLSDGYPQANFDGRRGRRVNRLVLGLVDPKVKACHKCDNILCVNPEHLFSGSQSDNIKDSWNKGRQVGNSKLSKKDCEDILKLREGGVKQIDIALRYDVDRHTIAKISLDYLRKRYG